MAAIPIPDWTRHQLLQALPYGKVLPTAIYLHRDTDACLAGPLAQILTLLARRHTIGEEFNVVKFRTDAPRLSFLCYPGFFQHPHPSLEEAIAIDLSSGRLFHTAYRDNLNPPILHRKELLLPPITRAFPSSQPSRLPRSKPASTSTPQSLDFAPTGSVYLPLTASPSKGTPYFAWLQSLEMPHRESSPDLLSRFSGTRLLLPGISSQSPLRPFSNTDSCHLDLHFWITDAALAPTFAASANSALPLRDGIPYTPPMAPGLKPMSSIWGMY